MVFGTLCSLGHPSCFSGWQIVQEEEGVAILLTGVPEGFADRALEEQIRQSLIAEGASAPVVRVRRVAAIARSSSGKLMLIKPLPRRVAISRPAELETAGAADRLKPG